MPTHILATKLYIPRLRPNVVRRPRLLERLNEGLHSKLTLISAPAGFGKTTLVSAWVEGIERPVAWLSLDEGDSDPARFLTYFVAALQTIAPKIGVGVMSALQSPQPPPPEAMLMTLLNDIAAIPEHFVLVLDDYHMIAAKAVDQALTYFVEHLPPQMHLVIATREDPALPLARLRARGYLTEVRAADLRFTPAEAAAFLNQAMGLTLSAEDIAALERRTEGWIAGLQFAALSLQGQPDAAGFIRSFTGSHHFVLDYLVEEVLGQHSERVQRFLLCTSILDRMSGPLCDAVVLDPSISGQATLEYLEHANLFIIPLDDERRWYRYHHLFADLLRLRLHQSIASSPAEAQSQVNELYIRASLWYEDHGLSLEAFQHAAAAHDVERAARLVEGEGMPLLFRGAVTPVLHWLESLPKTALDARPSLWVMYASALTMTGFLPGIEEKLQAAEAAMQGTEPDDTTKDVVGQIAAIRAMLAVPANQLETIIAQSRRALEYLHPSNLAARTSTLWTLGFASFLQGDRAAAAHLAQTYDLPLSQARVHLAQGDTSAALAALSPGREQVEAKEWQDERLQVMVLQAVALQAHGEQDKAVHLLCDALALAEPGGFIRLFVDEGRPMAHLLSEAEALGMVPDYLGKLLAVFEAEEQNSEAASYRPTPAQLLIEPLSPRELEVLQLMAQGLSNQEMSERLVLALDTVKGHNKKIFGKLQVQRRTEAVARARELGLL